MKVDEQIIFDKYESSEIVMTQKIRHFFDNLTHEKLSLLVNAANYFYYPVLLETGCNYLAFLVQEKPPTELKTIFGDDEEYHQEFFSHLDWMSDD